MPMPSQVPTSVSNSMAVRSPACATSVTSGPVRRAGSPATRSYRSRASGLLAATSPRASRTSALPEAYCSQHPRLPHSQRWPPGTTCMWPNSPAIPNSPRITSPPMRMPPPMPVPRVIIIAWVSPRTAPYFASAHMAALASLSMKIGWPIRSLRRSRRGSLRQDRCGEKTMVARSAATNPAAPIPMATIGSAQLSMSSVTTPTIVSSTTWGRTERSGVSARARRRTCPEVSTTPAATLVPPMSTPMASAI